MFDVCSRVQWEMRVRGLTREVQAVASWAGKRNLPQKLISEKEDDKQTLLVLGYHMMGL